MANPFKYGGEVSGYRFYDRKEDAKKLHRRLVDGSTNVVLYAPRRYGKTSLVLKVLEQLRTEDSIPGLIFDMTKASSLERFCAEYANAVFALVGGRKELFHKIADWLQHLHPKVSFGGDGGAPGVSFDYGERMSALSISEVLDLPEKLMHELGGKPLVVAFDEFQEIAGLSGDIPLESVFRSCIQEHRFVRYVFLGSKTHLMRRMFGERTSPLYKAAQNMRIGKPPVSTSEDYIVSRFEGEGLSVSDEALRRIIEVSENIPYYVQAVSAYAFMSVERRRASQVVVADVDFAVERLVESESDYYEELLHGLSSAQRSVAEALAAEPVARFDETYRRRHALPGLSTVHSCLVELTLRGIVDKEDGKQRLDDPFLVHYINRTGVATLYT